MSTTIIEELTQGLRETREEVRTLRMLVAEQGKRIAIAEKCSTTVSETLSKSPRERRGLYACWLTCVECAADGMSVSAADVLGRGKTTSVVIARHIARHLLRITAGVSQSIAVGLCGCNRNTLNASLSVVDHLREMDNYANLRRAIPRGDAETEKRRERWRRANAKRRNYSPAYVLGGE